MCYPSVKAKKALLTPEEIEIKANQVQSKYSPYLSCKRLNLPGRDNKQKFLQG